MHIDVNIQGVLVPASEGGLVDLKKLFHSTNPIIRVILGLPIEASSEIEGYALKGLQLSQRELDYLKSAKEFRSETVLASEIVKLLLHYPSKLTEQEFEVYLNDWIDDLSPYPIWVVRASFRIWRKTSVYKPKICEIINLINELNRKVDSSWSAIECQSKVEPYAVSLIKEHLGIHVFSIWLKNCEFQVEANRLLVTCPSRFVEGYVRDNYLSVIISILQSKSDIQQCSLTCK